MYCFLTTMAGANRRTRSSGSTAQASTGLINVPDDDDRYESKDSQHQIPPEGFAARRSREIPNYNGRTPETLPHEDHMEFCFVFRQQCQWYQDKEFVKL